MGLKMKLSYKEVALYILKKNVRKYATKPKLYVEMEEHITSRIENEELKPRKHPGVMKLRTVEVPAMIVTAMLELIKDKPIKTLYTDGSTLARYLKARHPPAEHAEIISKEKEIQHQIEAKYGIDSLSLSEEEREKLNKKLKNKLTKRLGEFVYSWKPVEYNTTGALQYMVSRFAPEYAVLQRIFMELKTRDPDFQPQTLFDFGSGVGTVTWAAKSVWDNSIKEHFNVDSSADMNDLASFLLKCETEEKEMPLKGIYYRQFLPASQTLKYDIVVSAYTLLELPSTNSRLKTIVNLWNKTHKYLIIVEQGTNAGFKVINEARDFVLHLAERKEVHVSVPIAHIFSPCPHDLPCPRFMHDTTPCNFEVSYIPLHFSRRLEARKERFSYVVLKKGPRPTNDAQWPRIVRYPLVRKKHTICRMCVAAGKLEEIIFTASKHGKPTYRCARSSNWGDLLPITIKDGKNEEGEDTETEEDKLQQQ